MGYSLAFSEGSAGDSSAARPRGNAGIGPTLLHGAVPEPLFATFQLSFAIITAALVSGRSPTAPSSPPDGVRSWWSILVVRLCPLAWGSGWLAVQDGRARLRRWPRRRNRLGRIGLGPCAGPARVSVSRWRPCARTTRRSCFGVGLLVRLVRLQRRFGTGSQRVAAAGVLNTLVAGLPGMLGWLTVEQVRDGKTTFDTASGVVAGLAAITPSCGTVNVAWAPRWSVWQPAWSVRVRHRGEVQIPTTTTHRRRRRRTCRRCGRRPADRDSGHRGDDRRPLRA